MNQLFSKFLVAFFLTSAVVLSWSEYFLIFVKPPHIRIVSLCMTIDDEEIAAREFGTCLVLQFAVKTSITPCCLYQGLSLPAIIMQEIFPKEGRKLY